MAGIGPIVAFVIALCFIGKGDSAQYLGKFLGKLSELHHGVSGEVYAVDGRTLHIKDFTYDGQGPAAYFYASTHKVADKSGFRLRDENGKGEVIRRYRKEGVTITLPEGKTLNNIKLFYVWCEDFDVNFGDVKIPKGFDFPRPHKIDPLHGVHGISSDNIVIVDAQTLLVPNLSYDGQAPDAKFWVGTGSKPSPQGIRVPDENGKELPLRRYDGKNVVLTLPGDLTVFDIGHFGIWCEKFTVDFGHVPVPQGLNIPPSLKMLGVSPQSKLNCEVLYDDLAFEVRWAVAGESIVVQLVAKLEDREYMSFGISGDAARSVMIGGDPAVCWIEPGTDQGTVRGHAVDYYLQDKAQCSGPTGSCPDNRLAVEESDSVEILNAAKVNGYSIVTYKRPLKAADVYDLPVLTNTSQAVIWAIGPLNQRDEVSFHNHYLKTNMFLDFGRVPRWNCPVQTNELPPMLPVQRESKVEATEGVPVTTSSTTNAPRRSQGRRRGGTRRPQPSEEEAADDSEKSASLTQQQRRRGNQRTATRAIPSTAPIVKRDAWVIPPIMCYEPEDGVFYAQMGPTGGKRGYPAITGHVGWGISWYINGLLIPEINVVRGKMYTFVVEGGHDPEVSAKYHPFYITDDPVGGYEYKTQEERKNIRIFAGVRQGESGSVEPTGTGRLCHWTQTGDSDADDFDSFGAYQRTLELKCDPGEPGVIQWTPDKDTPDTVFYQCFTHRYLGWKINVHDSCDEQPAASEVKPVKIEAPAELQDKSDIDLDESPSIRIETRVNPNTLFKEDEEDKEFKSTVSEKKVIPSTLDPLPSTRQPQEKLPIEPIPTQSQQSHFDPFYQSTGPYFAQLTHNPNPFEQTQQQPPQYFRPSTLLNTVHEKVTPDIIRGVYLASTTTSSTTTTTPASTTTKVTSTTEKPSTTTQFPLRLTDNIAVAANDRQNLTFIMPPPVNLHLPPPKFNGLVLRRPLGPPPVYPNRPMQFPIKMMIRPPMRQFPMQKITYKKIYRPQQYKMPHAMSHMRPFALPFENKPMFFPYVAPKAPVAPSYFLSQPTVPTYSTQSPLIQKQMINVIVTESTKTDEIRNVEISPQQASTEREPEIQTAPSTLVMDITPTFIRPAYNTGFKPGSVKIESGFKPIVSKEFQDRMDNDEPDIEYESEMGVVNVDNSDQFEFKPIQSFEPMFVPSPTDKTVKEKRVKMQKRILKKRYYPYTKFVLKRPRSLPDTMEEPIAEAAERVETYYLPPSDNKNKPIDIIRKPSNIDIEAPDFSNIDSPPDVVVAYDGRKVSGQSLTAKLTDHSIVLDQRLSKASQYIKTMPQVGKFKGELPPLNPAFIDKNAPQLQSKSGVLSRDLDTPSLPSQSYLPQSLTRLSRVRKEDAGSRRKRAAHHTPEHTAEQEKRRNGTITSSAHLTLPVNSYLTIIVVAYFLKYL